MTVQLILNEIMAGSINEIKIPVSMSVDNKTQQIVDSVSVPMYQCVDTHILMHVAGERALEQIEKKYGCCCDDCCCNDCCNECCGDGKCCCDDCCDCEKNGCCDDC